MLDGHLIDGYRSPFLDYTQVDDSGCGSPQSSRNRAADRCPSVLQTYIIMNEQCEAQSQDAAVEVNSETTL